MPENSSSLLRHIVTNYHFPAIYLFFLFCFVSSSFPHNCIGLSKNNIHNIYTLPSEPNRKQKKMYHETTTVK